MDWANLKICKVNAFLSQRTPKSVPEEEIERSTSQHANYNVLVISMIFRLVIVRNRISSEYESNDFELVNLSPH